MAQCFLPIPFACDGWAPRKAICSWWFVWARTKKYFIAALNNESFEINEYRIQTFNLPAFFAAFFSSCYLGLRKPDEKIYRRALYMAHRQPAESIFIDDRELNVECAKQLGMHGIHFQNAKQLRNDLTGLGVTLDA